MNPVEEENSAALICLTIEAIERLKILLRMIILFLFSAEDYCK